MNFLPDLDLDLRYELVTLEKKMDFTAYVYTPLFTSCVYTKKRHDRLYISIPSDSLSVFIAYTINKMNIIQYVFVRVKKNKTCVIFSLYIYIFPILSSLYSVEIVFGRNEAVGTSEEALRGV